MNEEYDPTSEIMGLSIGPQPQLSSSPPRPALMMMEDDQQKNLERVLLMNLETMQQLNSRNTSNIFSSCPEPQEREMPLPSGQDHDRNTVSFYASCQPQAQSCRISPNTLNNNNIPHNGMGPTPTSMPPTTQGIPPNSPFSTPSNQGLNPYILMYYPPTQQNFVSPTSASAAVQPPTPLQTNDPSHPTPAFSPVLPSYAYPVPIVPYSVPFWSACPLPFSPLAYPQTILPQTLRQPVQTPIGPQILRPVNFQVAASPLPGHLASQQTVVPNGNVAVSVPSMMSDDESKQEGNGTSKEQALSKYRMKRAKRKWSRRPDPRLSQLAQTRARDENGKFVKSDVTRRVEEYEKTITSLQDQLNNSQVESRLLLEQLNAKERQLNMLRNSNGSNPSTIKPSAISYEDVDLRDAVFRNPVDGTTMPGVTVASRANEEAQMNSKTIYNPFRGGNSPVDAFRQKINLSQKRQDLRQTKPPCQLQEHELKAWCEAEFDQLFPRFPDGEAGPMDL